MKQSNNIEEIKHVLLQINKLAADPLQQQLFKVKYKQLYNAKDMNDDISLSIQQPTEQSPVQPPIQPAPEQQVDIPINMLLPPPKHEVKNNLMPIIVPTTTMTKVKYIKFTFHRQVDWKYSYGITKTFTPINNSMYDYTLAVDTIPKEHIRMNGGTFLVDLYCRVQNWKIVTLKCQINNETELGQIVKIVNT